MILRRNKSDWVQESGGEGGDCKKIPIWCGHPHLGSIVYIFAFDRT